MRPVKPIPIPIPYSVYAVLRIPIVDDGIFPRWQRQVGCGALVNVCAAVLVGGLGAD